EDEAHWRTTVVRNSYDAAPEELRSLAPERAGDFAVAGGGRVGTWLGGPGRFVVSPLADLDRSGRLARATASLSPELGAFEALDAAVEGDGCRVAPDETVLGRRAERVDCRGQSGRWDTSLWLDSATGIVLRLTAATGDRGQVLSPPFLVEVRRLDLSPAFGPATFTVEAPAGARTVWAGNGPAPEEYRVQPGPSVTHRIPVAPGGTSALAVGDDGAVWALGWARRPQPGEADPDRTLSRIDARSAEVTFSVPVSRYAQSVAVAGGWVWVAGTELVAEGSSDDKGNVTPARYAAVVERYEPATGRSAGVPLRIDGSGDTGILVVAGDELWFTGGPGHEFATGRSTASYSTLVRIDTATGAIAGELPVAGAVLGADATGRGGALWMMVSSVEPSDRENPDRPAVVALDPGSGAETARFPVAGPLSFAVGDGDLWVLMAETGPDTPAALRRIEARTGRELGRAEVGPEPMAVAAAGGSVWVTNRDDGTLLRLDPGTLEVRQVVVVGGSPGRIAWSAGAVWVADALEGTVSRVVP
ncbi:MAG TPA: hypothetical protein VFO65_02935, partial [Acidimicrobiales bacterium]|nr:hypothetical protein [Acidimicrobiales bacterium]